MENNETLRILAATAMIMLVFEANKAYNDAKPSLAELRDKDKHDGVTYQRLIDADITVGIPVMLAAGVASYVMRSWIPVVVVIVACVAVGGYHHSILSDPGTDERR